MRLTHSFYLATKSKRDLSALYRLIFNRVADPKLTDQERRTALLLLQDIRMQLGL
jgi:hypothetical protein